MNTFSIWKSKTFWGTVAIGVVHILEAGGVIPHGVASATGEAIGGAVAAAGVRGAIAKNGAGK
jgi:hypothetical protein